MSGGGAVSWATIARVILAGLGVWIFVETWRVWMLLLIAVIVAVAILPAVRWGDRHRIPRVMFVAGIFLGAIAVAAVLGILLMPAFIEQETQFARQLPALIENVRELGARLVAWSAHWEIPAPGSLNGVMSVEGIGEFLFQNTIRATALSSRRCRSNPRRADIPAEFIAFNWSVYGDDLA